MRGRMTEPARDHQKGRFKTTRWSLVLALREDGAREALSTLCEIYWTPVYAFIRRSGRPVEDARDLTQAFFTAVIDKGHFAKARQERGRFRSFLLSAVRICRSGSSPGMATGCLSAPII